MATSSRLQSTELPPWGVQGSPRLVVADENVTPLGSASVTTTPLASPAPKFWTATL